MKERLGGIWRRLREPEYGTDVHQPGRSWMVARPLQGIPGLLAACECDAAELDEFLARGRCKLV